MFKSYITEYKHSLSYFFVSTYASNPVNMHDDFILTNERLFIS